MMSVDAIRLGTFQGHPNGKRVRLPGGVTARVWHAREAARDAAEIFSVVSLHNRRVESCKLPLVLIEAGTV